MVEKEKIRPFYSELQGYLSQAPADGGVSYDMLEQVNQAIENLSRVTGEDYSRFKMVSKVEPDDDPLYAALEVDLYRSKLDGLIMNIHGQYFSTERPPFSGEPSKVIVQPQEHNKDTKSKVLHYFLDMLLKASGSELLIVALFAYVALLCFVNYIINNINYLDQRSGWKCIIICVITIIYVVAVIILFWGRRSEQKFRAARDRIEIYLKEKLKRLSFDRVREEIDVSYTDDFLEKLIKTYPKVFRRCTIKTSQGNKPGITLTRDE